MTGDNLQTTRDQLSPRCLVARWVVPVSQPPLHRGWVQVLGSNIVKVGSGNPDSPVTDLGDVALLPRLVNAHTHLEFSDCDLPIGRPGTPLCDWIGQVVASRVQATAAQTATAIAHGVKESDDNGVCLIGEITTPPCRYSASRQWPQIHSFAEVLGLTQQRSDERLAAAREHLSANSHAGLSPHAPYSTSRQAIQSCVDLARRHRRTLAMHVAESPAERELLTHGSGCFVDALKELGAWQTGLFPWSSDPFLDLIDQLSLATRALLIHGNDLSAVEIERLTRYPQMSVVYCPRTHAFFRYQQHPVDRLLAAGVRVALGTDSRASNPDLSVWGEVQYLLRHRPDLDPHSVIEMATVCGADALGRPDLGRLEAGARATLGFVHTRAARLDDLYKSLAEQGFQSLPAGKLGT